MNLDEERAYIAETALANFHEECNEMDEGSFKDNTDAMELYMKYAMQFPQLEPQLEMILADTAKKYKISKKTISDCIKVYKRSTRPVSGEGTLTAWEGQPFAVNVGTYILDGETIREQTTAAMTPVCNHPIMISKRYVDIESGEESVELSYRRDGRWHRVPVDKTQISDRSKIVPLSGKGVSVTSENAQALVKYLNYVDDRNRAQIPICKMSSRIGWASDGSFIPYNPEISYGGPETFRGLYETIHEHGSMDAWLKTMRAVRSEKGSAAVRIVLAASFASVLLKPFNALPFVVHLWSAVSGTGKTVALELAASVWAKPGVGDYVRSFNATQVAIEQTDGFCNDCPLILDEFQTVQGTMDVEKITYAHCEGVGKGRGARQGGLRQTLTWHNCMITSGEMPINSATDKAGALNRVIEVGTQGMLMTDPRAVHLSIMENYGHAGKLFVNSLKDYMDEAKEKLKAFEDVLRGKCTDKQNLSAQILLLGDWLAEKIVFQDGNTLDVYEILPYLKTSKDVDTNLRAYEWLTGWVAENHVSFATKRGEEENVEMGVKLYGRIDTETDGSQVAWISSKALSDALKTQGFSPESFRKWAAAEGKLVQRQGSYTPNIKFKRITIRCIGLKLNNDEKPDQMTPVHDPELPF